MKKLIFLAMTIVAVIITSCSKDETVDFTKPENLSGTTWKCTSGTEWNKDVEYAVLIFTSTTAIEGWTKYIGEGEQKQWTGSFTISNGIISISYGNESFTGIIEGKNMNTTIDGETFIFSKQ